MSFVNFMSPTEHSACIKYMLDHPGTSYAEPEFMSGPRPG